MSTDGTPNDDSLSGTSGDDTLNGLDGDDNLYGYGGSDTLNGGNDNDYLDGGTGSDVLNGGAGDDLVIADLGDVIDGGTGRDTASIDLSTIASNSTYVLKFGDGIVNTLAGGTTFQNIEMLDLTTGAGNDTITFDSSVIYGSGSHNSYWHAGAGDDHVIVDWSNQKFSIYGGVNGMTLGSTSLSFLSVDRFDLYGGSGNDAFTGGAEADTLVGNDGNDNLSGAGGNDTLYGGAGNDVITAGNGFDNAGIDNINGGDGDDQITAAFKDRIDGGAGRDALTLDLSDQTANAKLNFDPTETSKILNTTFGRIENLYLTTGSGNDSLSIDSNAIQLAPSSDGSWNGGAGTDTMTINFADQIFGISITQSSITEADFSFALSNIEVLKVTTGSGNDTVTGASGNDTITTNAGNDTMYGYAGNDTFYGGDGRDTAFGGVDNDTLNGGDDRDYLSGEDGTDSIYGGAGRDTLLGGVGDDKLYGGAGNDKLEGDGGRDTLDGGGDSDTMWFSLLADSCSTSFDTVANFDFSMDRFHLNGGVQFFDGTIAGGQLYDSSFDSDLATAMGSLGSHHAVLFTPDAGDYAGSTFAIIDNNGVAGYQAGGDYVIRLTTPMNVGQADVFDFQA